MGRRDAYISLLASSGVTLHQAERISILPSDERNLDLRRLIADVSRGQISTNAVLGARLTAFLAEARQNFGAAYSTSRDALLRWHADNSSLPIDGASDVLEILKSGLTDQGDFSCVEIERMADKLRGYDFDIVHHDLYSRNHLGSLRWPFELFEVKKGGTALGAGCATQDALAKTRAICETIERMVAQTENSQPLFTTAKDLRQAGILTPDFQIDCRDAYLSLIHI